MSFKLDDYNAFLSSLYEKKPNVNGDQQSDVFPVDFDFCLETSTERLSNRLDNVNTEFLAETGASCKAYPPVLDGEAVQMSPTSQRGVSTYANLDEQFMTNSSNRKQGGPFISDPFPGSNFLPTTTDKETETCDELVAEAPRPRTKSSHNVIEQRYRNKINDKFTVLQNTVPSLRLAKRRLKGSTSSDIKHDDEEDAVDDHSVSEDEDLEGLEPAKKLNKGTILTKSIEYVQFLEMKNNNMHSEHKQLLMQAKMLGITVDDFLKY